MVDVASAERTDSGPNFRQRIDAITNRTLRPENIDTYADSALNDLIDVVGDVTALYDQQFATDPASGADRERAALVHFGLDGDEIGTTLDRINSLAEAIAELDAIIPAITTHTGEVITPPDETETRLIAGGGETYRPKQRIPRLKTLLLVLSNQFDINLLDADECRVADGIITSFMMRRESYKLVTVPNLHRCVLVCDEEDNATFVFDTRQLAALGVAPSALQGFTKGDIKDLLAANPGAGRRLAYSDTFTEEVTSLLETIPSHGAATSIDPDSGRLLGGQDRAAESHTKRRIATDLGATYDAVQQAAHSLADQLGIVETDTRSRLVYSAEQRELIRAWLAENGHFSPPAREGHFSAYRIARNLSVSDTTIAEAAKALGDELGPTERARVGRTYPTVYSPAQQAKIRNWLIKNNRIAGEEDAGSLPIDAVASTFGQTRNAMAAIIQRYADEVGDLKAIGGVRQLSSAQQGILLDILEREHYLVDPAPAGYTAEKQLPRQLGYSRFATQKAIIATGVRPEYFLIGKNSRRGKAYSPEQQAAMIEWLQTNGYTPTQRALGTAATGEDAHAPETDTPTD